MCFCSENVDFRGGMHGRGVCVAGACMAGGRAWQGGVHGRGACVAGGHVWQGGRAWQGGMCGRGVHGRGACMVGGMHGRGACVVGGHAWQGGMRGRGACVAGGHVWRGGAWPCDLSHHAFDVTCMLSPHQLRPTNSAAPYIVLVGHVTRMPPLLTESQTGVKT